MITRFAPSPTGPLHLGHAYSAILAHDMAMAENGTFLLRIEDIDTARCRPEWEAAILNDLKWLGLTWEQPVLRQSDHLQRYANALTLLADMGLCYACTCTRADIHTALSAPQEGAPHLPPDGAVYPGTCRHLGLPLKGGAAAIRLDLDLALATLGPVSECSFNEIGPVAFGRYSLDPQSLRSKVGDVVLARRDIGTAAYHLSVVLDDALQDVTHVVRGMDLFEATPIHHLLQVLLQLHTPTYYHHILIRDDQGKRLAKRDDAKSIAKFRAEGATPADIRTMVGL